MTIDLNKPFARNGKVDEFDVRRIKKALNRLGYYQPYEKTGITGMADAGVFAALKSFQKDQGLAPTGAAKPGDETIKALNSINAQKNGGRYIWRTVGDDKVRVSHAALNGTIRDFSESPDPGDEFDCRCWAELVAETNNCDDTEQAWVNAEAQLFIAKQVAEQAEKEKIHLEVQLKQLQALLKKESSLNKGDKGKARHIVGAIGAITGGILAGASGVAPGLSAGSALGPLLEESSDLITGQKTDIQIKQEIKDTRDRIGEISRRMSDDLKPAITRAEALVKEAREAYFSCQDALRQR